VHSTRVCCVWKNSIFLLFFPLCVGSCDIPCVFGISSMGSWYRAAREARDVNQMLVYVQAIDVPRKDVLSAAELRRALQRLSMTETGNQMGMLPLYIGMMVRLTTKLSAAHRLMQDSVGTVVGIQFHEQEFVGRVQDDWRGNGAHDSWRRGYYKTRKMIKAVYVKFEDYDIDSGYGAGVVSVEPRSASWKFKTHDDLISKRRDLPMTRIQLPLAPARVRTVQTAQGMSMNAANMNLARPPTMSSDDDYWLHLYVMLSRVRTVGRLLLFGMPEQGFPPSFIKFCWFECFGWSGLNNSRCTERQKKTPRCYATPLACRCEYVGRTGIFERGPPKWVLAGVARFEALATANEARVARAMSSMGWTFASGAAASGGDVAARVARNRAVALERKSKRRKTTDGAVEAGCGGIHVNCACACSVLVFAVLLVCRRCW
jgi:hypothetical protein